MNYIDNLPEMKEMVYEKDRKQEILLSGIMYGRKFTIMNLGTHPTAYVELKPEEVNRSNSYNDYDLDVHGGFTYLDKAYWDEEDKSQYIGWDYSHWNDFCGYYINDNYYSNKDLKKWTSQEIFEEVKSVIEQFGRAEWVDMSEPHYVFKIKDNKGEN